MYLLLLIFAGIQAVAVQQFQHQEEVTKLLDNILVGYDKSIRPSHGTIPVIINTDIYIKSMGPISELDMVYSLDCYFRQTWHDERLSFTELRGRSFLVLSQRMLERIWKPDTYFLNGGRSYQHTLTVPNKLIRLYPNGTVLYSIRITVKASCPMYLRYFPIDRQICPLTLGSYAYTDKEVIYVWRLGDESIGVDNEVKLSQFILEKISCWNRTYVGPRGRFSTLSAEFHLHRHMGFFLIQVYVPCTLLVVLSWVSFWLNREATADRVSLGVTTVLTLTTLCIDSRHDVPRVSYATALDWFIVLCYVFIISSLFELAGVHYFTKFHSGEPNSTMFEIAALITTYPKPAKNFFSPRIARHCHCRRQAGTKRYISYSDYGDQIPKHINTNDLKIVCQQRHISDSDEEICKEPEEIKRHTTSSSDTIDLILSSMAQSNTGSFLPKLSINFNLADLSLPYAKDEVFVSGNQVYLRRKDNHQNFQNLPASFSLSAYSFYPKLRRLWDCLACLQGSAKYREAMVKNAATPGVNSVSQIDKMARIVFPTAFALINVFYWISFTNTNQMHYRFNG